MSEISSLTTKYRLLEQTKEIEDQENERANRKLIERNNKYNTIKAKNDVQSQMSQDEVTLRKEEAVRRELISGMDVFANEHQSLSPVTDVLKNFDGILFKSFFL